MSHFSWLTHFPGYACVLLLKPHILIRHCGSPVVPASFKGHSLPQPILCSASTLGVSVPLTFLPLCSESTNPSQIKGLLFPTRSTNQALFITYRASLIAQLVKNSPAMAGDPGSILGSERSPGEGKDYPLQYSGLENSMDCIVHGVTKSQTQLREFHCPFHHLQN